MESRGSVASAVARFEQKQETSKHPTSRGAKSPKSGSLPVKNPSCTDGKTLEKSPKKRHGGESSSSLDSPPPASTGSSCGEQRAGQDFQWASNPANPFHNATLSGRCRRSRRDRDLKSQSCFLHGERDLKSQSCLGHGHVGHPSWQQGCCHGHQMCCMPPAPRCSSWDLCLLGKAGMDVEGERDVLRVQVQVLEDKIADLTQCLDEKRHQLNTAENLLQREMLTRSALETQKLELMSTISELKLTMAAMERENEELREDRRRYQVVRPPISARPANPFTNHHQDPAANPFSSSSTPKPHIADFSQPSLSPVMANSLRRDFYMSSGRRSMDQFSSLPRQKIAAFEAKKAVTGNRKLAFLTLKSEKSHSAPNLADSQRVVELDLAVPVEITPAGQHQPGGGGFRKIFTKLRRSQSGSVPMSVVNGGELRRGGLRATAHPRLQLTYYPSYLDVPVSQWNKERVCEWLEAIGLENYVADARRWVQSGAHLLAASPHELEKEFGIKNPLHKKKLLLAIQALQKNSSDPLLPSAALLDTHWVLRWLDDIGLPQYKDVFLTGRVDGLVLHRLTMEDLATLHITSLLHIASLRHGIQVLREHRMDGSVLTRRSVVGEKPPEPADIALWTNHRVMDWLHAIDLAEYAPNLRGSGVHGGLIVHEVKFNGELLAALLNIPPSKTLLRRHLTTHFNNLLGRDLVGVKRQAETTLGYIPLTPSAKIKIPKRSQFTLKRKKSKSELDFGDLVCPLHNSNSAATGSGDDRPPSGDGMMRKPNHVPDVCLRTDAPVKFTKPPSPNTHDV